MKSLTAFFLLTFLLFLASCSRPQTFSDRTGKYTHLQGREYLKLGDTIHTWGQQVYRITKSRKPIKGEIKPVANPYVAK